MFKAEWKQIKDNKMLMLIIAGMLAVPVMYAAVFLSGVWDPYGKLDELPVAVVNEDVEATFEGTELHVGDELVDNLKDNEQFDWHFIEREEAMAGIDEGDYYMVIVIPEHFSEHATTALDDEPQEMELEYYTSAGRNFIAEQLVGTAASAVEQEIAQTVSREYIATLFDVLAETADGLAEGSDGAIELEEGGEDLFNNLATLASSTLTFQVGLGEAESGAGEIALNLSDLTSGATELAEGLGTYTSGVNVLTDGVGAYTDAAGTLADGVGLYVQGSETLAAGATAYTEAVEGALEQAQPYLVELRSPLEQAQIALSNLNVDNSLVLDYTEGVTTLAQGVTAYKSGVDTLTGGVSEAANTVIGVSDGLSQQLEDTSGLTEVSESLLTGSRAVQAGLDGLLPGLNEVNSGVSSFATEMAQLHDGVEDVAALSATAYERLQERLQGVESPDVAAAVAALTELRDDINTLAPELTDMASPAQLIGTLEEALSSLSAVDTSITAAKEANDAAVIAVIESSEVDLTDDERAGLIAEVQQVQSEQRLPSVVGELEEALQSAVAEARTFETAFAGVSGLSETLVSMETRVNEGLTSLEEVENVIEDAKQAIADAVLETAGDLNERVQETAGAAEQLATGLNELDQATLALAEGAQEIQPGATAVLKGSKRLLVGCLIWRKMQIAFKLS